MVSDVRRVLLVGFMGSGKSTVGPLLAERLSWRFVDFDDVVEEREGLSVAEIFGRHGEGRFRRVEAEVAERLLGEDHIVLGSGGGWAAAPGRLDALPNGTLSVWLQVSPAEAVERVSPEAAVRPLLAGGDPLAAAEALLSERARHYGHAHLKVETDGRTPQDVAAEILTLLERWTPGRRNRELMDFRG
jgi:shikimate kinase